MPQKDPEAPGSTPPTDPEDDLLARHLDEVMSAIRWVCRKHHLSTEEAEEFTSIVLLKLADNDRDVLRKFQGRSTIRTYLIVVIEHLFLDFRAKHWGKWRPSAEGKRCGPVGVLLEQLMVRDGHSFDEACELLASRHNVSMSRAELEAMAARLPVRSKRRFDTDDVLHQLPSKDPQPDADVIEEEEAQTARRVAATLKQCLLELDNKDRLIITMRFGEGRLVSHIATALDIDQTQLYRRIERILRELRRALEAAGFSADVIRGIWGNYGFDDPE